MRPVAMSDVIMGPARVSTSDSQMMMHVKRGANGGTSTSQTLSMKSASKMTGRATTNMR